MRGHIEDELAAHPLVRNVPVGVVSVTKLAIHRMAVLHETPVKDLFQHQRRLSELMRGPHREHVLLGQGFRHDKLETAAINSKDASAARSSIAEAEIRLEAAATPEITATAETVQATAKLVGEAYLDLVDATSAPDQIAE